MSVKVPQPLKMGDKIAITCPAKKLPGDIRDAISLLESWGLEVVLGESVTASHHQFAGTDELRREDMQRFLDDDSIKAIIAARGGYGCIRIIDQLDFTRFAENLKWISGFSDVTVFHSHIYAKYGISTIHGQMPLTIPDSTKPALETLRKALFGEEISYGFPGQEANTTGEASGVLIGGNLMMLMVMTGSESEIDYQDKILFIEDIGEYLYAVDRMMWHLDRAGKLSGLKGVLVGGFTELKDNDIPYGQTAKEIIREHLSRYTFPVCFDFPAGHIADNHAMILGKTVNLKVEPNFVTLTYL